MERSWCIFNSLSTYQVLQLVEKEVVIIIAQIDVEEVNGSTSDGTRQLCKRAHLMLIMNIKNQLKN
jgi:hypothetical protein